MSNILHLVPHANAKEISANAKKKPKNTLPDGRKRIRLDVGRDAEGKRVRKTFTGRTLAECRAKRDAYLAEQARQQAAATPKSVADWAATWRAVYGSDAGYSQNRTVEIDVRRLCAYMGGMALTEVQQVHVQAYAQSVAHYAKSTVQKIKATANRIFAAAVANGYIMRNPCAGVVWKHAGEGTHRFLEPWEIATITAHWQDHHAGLWAMLMLYAGLRRGEALALRWSDIDGDVIHVKQGVHFEDNSPISGAPKTPNAVRDVPVLGPLRDALQAAPRVGEYICLGAGGQAVTSSIWASGWVAYCHAMQRAAGRPFNVRAHDLRHTFASMLYDAGVDIKTAQKLLGHATPEITMRIYTHLSEVREAASLDKMREYLEGMGREMGHKEPEKPVK